MSKFIKIMNGNIPVYVTIILTVLISLISFVFVSTTSALRSDLDKVQDESSVMVKDVSYLKADNKTMQEWLTRIEKKLDTVISQK